MRPRTVASALAVGVLVSGGWACSPDSPPSAEDLGTGTRPVITPAEPWNGYPGAIVSGDLHLRHGCLLLNDDVVFWPYGTGWDDATHAVTFDDHPPAPVGEFFKGGGGAYGLDVKFKSWLGAETGGAIRDCLHKTGSSLVVFAYPPLTPE